MGCFVGYLSNNIQFMQVELKLEDEPQYLSWDGLKTTTEYRIPEGYKCLKFSVFRETAAFFSVKCRNTLDNSLEIFLFKRGSEYVHSTIHYPYQYMLESDLYEDPESHKPKIFILEEDLRISVFNFDKAWFKLRTGYFQEFVESESYTGGNIARLPIYVENLERGIYIKKSGGGHLKMQNKRIYKFYLKFRLDYSVSHIDIYLHWLIRLLVVIGMGIILYIGLLILWDKFFQRVLRRFLGIRDAHELSIPDNVI